MHHHLLPMMVISLLLVSWLIEYRHYLHTWIAKKDLDKIVLMIYTHIILLH